MSAGSSDEEETELQITIFYGSQTGTAADYATSVFQLARRCHAHATLVNLADPDALLTLTEADLAVFCIATAGTGELPSPTRDFWQLLRRESLDASALFEDLSFAVLGLGDTKYPLFNYAAKKVRRRLLQLGGEEILPAAYADESAQEHGLDIVVGPWQDALKTLLVERSGRPAMGDDVLLSPVSRVDLVDGAEPEIARPDHARPLPARVLRNDRFTPASHWQDIRQFDVAMPSANIGDAEDDIEPGDVLCLMPVNTDAEVDRFLELLRWTEVADKALSISSPLDPQYAHELQPLTLRKLAKYVLPLTGVPRPSLFTGLKYFCTVDDFREKFQDWETLEGKDDFYDYVTRVRRTLLEVLDDFAHGLDVPCSYVLDLFGTMAIREYSIAGARRTDKDHWRVECLIALVTYQTRIRQPRIGVASRYLQTLAVNETVSAFVRKNPMPRPAPNQPILCIGPGTGFAPLRFLLSQPGWCDPAQSSLLFGCRGKEDDLTRTLQTKAPLKHAWVATSRTDDKTYVQWLMRDEPAVREAVKRLLESGGRVYLSGSSGKMPEGVKEVISEILADEEAVSKLVKEGRWWEETW